jgi:complex iron-sulfur molybdoenzyme family reductase subunit gamma
VTALLAALEKSGDLIIVKKTAGDIPLDSKDEAWNAAERFDIPLVSQNSVLPRAPEFKRGKLTVRGLYNNHELGILLSWSDSTRDAQEAGSEFFRDSVAVGFPMTYGMAIPLPYIGMGNQGRPVNIWHWKASWQADVDHGFQGSDTQHPETIRDQENISHLTGQEAGSPLAIQKRTTPVENLLAEGFGTLTSTPINNLAGRGVWQDGTWSVVIKRKLAADSKVATDIAIKKGLLPVTFAVWDGAARERNGIKGLTRWRFLKFEGENPAPATLQALVWKSAGNAENGGRLVVEAGCMACHNLPGTPAVKDIGPDLSNAGAIHHPDYLLESIKNPNAVIVNAPGYVDPKTGVSTMPSYEGVLEEKDYRDIVEYLRTLQ